MWVYVKDEQPFDPATPWCVGFFVATRKGSMWHSEDAFATKLEAAALVNYLNGGIGQLSA